MKLRSALLRFPETAIRERVTGVTQAHLQASEASLTCAGPTLASPKSEQGLTWLCAAFPRVKVRDALLLLCREGRRLSGYAPHAPAGRRARPSDPHMPRYGEAPPCKRCTPALHTLWSKRESARWCIGWEGPPPCNINAHCPTNSLAALLELQVLLLLPQPRALPQDPASCYEINYSNAVTDSKRTQQDRYQVGRANVEASCFRVWPFDPHLRVMSAVTCHGHNSIYNVNQAKTVKASVAAAAVAADRNFHHVTPPFTGSCSASATAVPPG